MKYFILHTAIARTISSYEPAGCAKPDRSWPYQSKSKCGFNQLRCPFSPIASSRALCRSTKGAKKKKPQQLQEQQTMAKPRPGVSCCPCGAQIRPQNRIQTVNVTDCMDHSTVSVLKDPTVQGFLQDSPDGGK